MKSLICPLVAAVSLTLGVASATAAPLPVQTTSVKAPIVETAMSDHDMMMHHKMMKHHMMRRDMHHKMMMRHHTMMRHHMMHSGSM